MQIEVAGFSIHDVSEFPIVRQRAEAVRPGYSLQWESEMDALLRLGTPFVVILDEGQPQESHEDRKTRGLWLKRNKGTLAVLCKAVIGIEGNILKRAALQAQAAMAAKAFGTTMEIAASGNEAIASAKAILGEISH